MSLLQLRTPSFRSRLRLFFVAIVVVPMITMAVVLFLLFIEAEQNQTEGRLSEAVTVSQEILREASVAAGDVARTIGRDQGLADARKAQDRRAIERRLEALRARTGAQYVDLHFIGLGGFEAGDTPAMVPVLRGLDDQNDERTGSVRVSMVSPDSYAERIRRLTGARVVVEQNDEQLNATGPDTPSEIPNSGNVPDTDWTASSFDAPVVGGNVRVKLLLPLDTDAVGPNDEESLLLAAVFIGFLVLAFLFAVAVSRSLQSEIQRLLEAARALGRGDFSVAVP